MLLELKGVPSGGCRPTATISSKIVYLHPLEQEGPITEFDELAKRGLVHPNLINTITRQMRLTTMTDVQTRTINEALYGTDM